MGARLKEKHQPSGSGVAFKVAYGGSTLVEVLKVILDTPGQLAGPQK